MAFNNSTKSMTPRTSEKQQYWDLLNKQAAAGEYTERSPTGIAASVGSLSNPSSTGGSSSFVQSDNNRLNATSDYLKSGGSSTANDMSASSLNTGSSLSGPSTMSPPSSQSGQMTNPAATNTQSTDSPYNSKIEDKIQERLDIMNDMIMRRSEEAKAQASRGSQMNQSTIRGNLGRLFGGSGYDSSEASPIINENNRLTTELAGIDAATQRSLQEENLNALNAFMGEYQKRRELDSQAQQNAFNQRVQEAQLTGSYGGANTMAMTKLLEDQATSQLNRALAEKGFISEEDQRMFKNNMDIIDQMLRTSEQKWNQGMDMRNYGLDYAQTQSGLMTDAMNRALGESEVTGVYQGLPTTQEDQRAIDNALALAQLTGYYNGVPTLGRDELTANDAYRYANLNAEDAYRYANMNANQAYDYAKLQQEADANFNATGSTNPTKELAELSQALKALDGSYDDTSQKTRQLIQKRMQQIMTPSSPLGYSPQDSLGAMGQALLQFLGVQQ